MKLVYSLTEFDAMEGGWPTACAERSCEVGTIRVYYSASSSKARCCRRGMQSVSAEVSTLSVRPAAVRGVWLAGNLGRRKSRRDSS